MALNAFNWRQTHAVRPTQFADDPNYRTPLYSKWCQTSMKTPWGDFRVLHEPEAKLERRVHGVTAGGHAERALGPLSRKGAKAKRSAA